ncbi:MAG: TerB family tellurite resistance protein [Polyangiaceae bacterium]|nr:TerB family tellurite resistance protein [Polyangiaceae bacterium]
MGLKLHRQAFVAVASVAWADGRLSNGESVGLLRAARESGIEGQDFEALETAVQAGVKLDDFDPSQLTDWEKAFAYAIAVFVAKLDGVVNPAESESLTALGAVLELPDLKLEAAASSAFDVACLPGGHRPDKYDFDALNTRLKEKLPSLRPGPDE